MEKITYFAETDGISLERMIRQGKFDMHVKHFHNEYEIFYLIEGERHFFFDNRIYVIKSGTLILVNENVIHMTRAINDEETGHDRIILYVGKTKMQELDAKFSNLNLVKFFREYYGVFYLTPEQQQDFMQFYKNLQQEFDSRKRNYKAMLEMEIIRYFIRFMREKTPHAAEDMNPAGKSKYQTVYAMADYISENYKKPLSLDALASRFYLSKYYLCRIFKEITGYGINEYINIHRIQKAKRLLEETDMNISEIAHSLGYESLTYFEKVFKTYMTISPLKYRKTLNIVTHTNQRE